MKTLAAIDGSGCAPGVLQTARSLAALLATEIEAVHVCEPGSPSQDALAVAGVPLRTWWGDPTTGILTTLADDDMVMAVIGTGGGGAGRSVLGHVARGVVTSTSKPIVLVPPDPMGFNSTGPAKVVVPLDGAPATAGGLQDVLDRLADRDMEIVAMHVLNATNAPQYWDHFYYDFPAWHERFRHDNCTSPSTRLEVGRGSVAAEVVRLAEAEGAGLIAVAWSQVLAPGRVLVVTELLRSTRVPLMLVPVDRSAAPPAPHLLEHAA
jgi:nucleotide-binding universal stress UspA family protein